MAQTSSNESVMMPFSCLPCRSRKLKCDRLKPDCTRCSTSGETCQYPATRKKPVILATRPKVKGLEARVVELEERLKAAEAAKQSQPQPLSLPMPFSDELFGTGRFEQLPPQQLIEELTGVYFTSLHSEAPMVHQSRFLASLYLPSHMQPPMCLQYAIMALSAMLVPSYSQLSQAFYRRARHYLEEDEMKGEGQHFVTVAHAQCWVLLGNYEAQNMWFSRSAMSTSRAVRLAQILGLHELDGVSAFGPTLPPPRDWCEQEERRRTLWVIFCMDRDTSSSTGWPHLLDPRKMQALLPASESAYDLAMEEPSMTLLEALSHSHPTASEFACRIVAVHLCHECLDHTYRAVADPCPADVHNSPFWQRHRELDDGLAAALANLPAGLHVPQNIHNHQAVFVNLQLHTAAICLHRSSAARAKKYNLDIVNGSDLAAKKHSHDRREGCSLLPAARNIFVIMATLTDVDALFRNPFVAFAAYMAAFVFLEDYASTQDRASEENLNSLLNFMIQVGHRNSVTASLAVQMAHELMRTGIDPAAMDKVQDLIIKVQLKGPLLAKQNEALGVVLCPFELDLGFLPEGVPAMYPTGISSIGAPFS